MPAARIVTPGGRLQGAWSDRWAPIVQIAVGITALALFFPLLQGHPAAASPRNTVGVADFYVRGPTPAISGLTPGRFAADDLAEVLPKASPHPVKVIPRDVLRKSEASMGWRNADAVSADRLAELARRVGAAYLIAGRVERLYTDVLSGGGRTRSSVRTTAEIRVQIFDPVHRRFTAGATGDGDAAGTVQRIAAEQALHRANAKALPPLLEKWIPGQ